MRNNLKIFLLATIIASFFILTPIFFKIGFTLYLERLDASSTIFLGSPIVCEELKTRISASSPVDRQDSLKQVLKILSLPIAEFNQQIQDKENLRRWMSTLSDDDALATGGTNYSQKCIYEVLTFFPQETEKILEALFKSELVNNAPNSQMKMGLHSFIQSQCKNNAACVNPLKTLVQNEDFKIANQYMYALAMIEGVGPAAILDIFDHIPDEKFKDTSYQNPERTKVSMMFSALTMSGSTPVAKDEINKRLSDPNYSSVKKELLKTSGIVGIAYSSTPYYSATPTLDAKDIISKGQELKKTFENKLPKDIDEIRKWLTSVDQLLPANLSDDQKVELTKLMEFFLKWTLENIGVTSTLVNQMIHSFSNNDKFKFPLPIAEEILGHSQFRLIGMKLFILETPINKRNEKLLLSNFSDLTSEDKNLIISFALQKNSTKGSQLMSLLFKMSLLLKHKEFFGFVNSIYSDKDNYILAWKNYSSTIGRKLNEDELWRYFYLTKNPELKAELLKQLSMKTICSPERLDVINSFFILSSDLSTFEETLETHLECAEKPMLKAIIMTMLRPFQYSDPQKKNIYLEMIKKNKKLSTATKKEFEKFLKSVEVKETTLVPPNEDLESE